MKIKEVRIARNMSQLEMASRAVPRLSTNTIYRIECGLGVTLSSLTRACDALGINPSDVDEFANVRAISAHQKKQEKTL